MKIKEEIELYHFVAAAILLSSSPSSCIDLGTADKNGEVNAASIV